ncbi:mpv17/PMP22 family protein [Rhodotorula toruloides]|uniref:Mpv17/PMP22 family protein n=1 Tax=Rhodotorula toruloides TaxID=5286 RepID=A0A511KBF5_RHOTO|nr:mpv17/PMP22 family protein [Rhodotorula toruloides]
MASPLKAAHTWLFDTHPKAGVAVMYGTLNAIGDTLAQVLFSSSPFDPARTLRFWLFGVGIAPLALMWNAYLERNYPLRPTSSVPHPEEPVTLESIQIHTSSHSRSSSLQTNGLGLADDKDAKLAHHRRKSSVGVQAVEAMVQSPLLGGQEAVGAKEDAVPSVDKVVLARRVGVDQIIMAPISFIVFLVAMGLMELKTPPQIWLKLESSFFAILWTNYKVWPFIQVVMFLYVPLKYRVPLSGCINVLWTVYLSWETAVKVK